MFLPEYFNEELIQNLPENNKQNCLMALIGLGYGLKTRESRVYLDMCVGTILKREGDLKYDFIINLYNYQNEDIDWIENYRLEFKKINPDRASTYTHCRDRWLKLKYEYPFLTKTLLKKGLTLYFRSLNDPKWLLTAHKFLYRIHDGKRESPLINILEKHNVI